MIGVMVHTVLAFGMGFGLGLGLPFCPSVLVKTTVLTAGYPEVMGLVSIGLAFLARKIGCPEIRAYAVGLLVGFGAGWMTGVPLAAPVVGLID